MTYILRTEYRPWTRVQKTLEIKAKHRACFSSIPASFASEDLSDDAMICLGDTGEYWQQPAFMVLLTYVIVGIDNDGWLLCRPRPEKEVQAFELTKDMIGMDSRGSSYVFIQCLKGESIMGIVNLQRAQIGDFICRQVQDHTDQWVVQRKIFLNTYRMLSDQEMINNQPWL